MSHFTEWVPCRLMISSKLIVSLPLGLITGRR